MWGVVLIHSFPIQILKLFQAMIKKKKREREREGKSLYQELACLFHLTENFLADAFAFLGTSRHANK